MAFDYDTYYRLDYIEADGTQYIDTGVAPSSYTNTLKIVGDMAYTEVPSGSTSQYLFGTGYYNSTATSRRTIAVGYRNSTSTSKVGYLNGAQFSAMAVFTNSTLDTDEHEYGIDQVNSNYIFDDSTQSFSTTVNSNLSATLVIFAGRNSASSGNLVSYYANAKLYAFKIYSSGTLIRDFIPAMNRTTNEVGVFDIANEVFYANAGTGDFTYGAIVPHKTVYVKTSIGWIAGATYIKLNGEWV